MSPKISVIIAVYNGENYLEEALDAAIKQNYPHKEIIVVNDGSNDRTQNIIQKFGKAILPITQNNQGIGSARNRGIFAASGDYFSFLDHDDLWTQDKLSLQMEAMKTGDEDDPLIFSHVQQFICPSLTDCERSQISVDTLLLPGYIAGTLLISKKRFHQVGLFSQKKEVGEFIDWYLRAKEANLPMKMLPHLSLLRRVHKNNMGRNRENMPKKSPLVSVIIPAHNGELYLRNAIQSVLDQEYQNTELWVIDNGSTDQTHKIAQSFPKVNYRYSEIGNVALARNLGISLSRGGYIAFLDQDDTWVPSKLTKQVHFLEENPTYGIVFSLQKNHLELGHKKPNWISQENLDNPQSAHLPSAMMVRHELFKSLGDFNPALPLASDADWLFKATYAGISIGTIKEVLIYRRIHSENNSKHCKLLHKDLFSAIRSSLKERSEIVDPKKTLAR
jgi:glycosyltransferase involved in cell wall biosynthesis